MEGSVMVGIRIDGFWNNDHPFGLIAEMKYFLMPPEKMVYVSYYALPSWFSLIYGDTVGTSSGFWIDVTCGADALEFHAM